MRSYSYNQTSKRHKCPMCGELTEGTFSEGGIKFAICEECYSNNYQKEDKKNE